MKPMKLLVLSILLVLGSSVYCQDFKEWDKHDVKAVYVEISSEKDADETFDDRYFEKTKLKPGTYEIVIGEKVNSKFWKIRNTNLFIYFRFNPFLFRFNKGVLDWNGYNGDFYKEP